MANYKGNHSQLKKIKKGEVRNPGGRAKLPEDIKEMRRKYSKEVIQGLLAHCLDKSVTELEAILKDRDNKVVDHLVGRVALLGIVNGDPMRFNFILDRLIGRVKEEKEIKVVEPFIIRGRDGQEIIMGVNENEELLLEQPKEPEKPPAKPKPKTILRKKKK